MRPMLMFLAFALAVGCTVGPEPRDSGSPTAPPKLEITPMRAPAGTVATIHATGGHQLVSRNQSWYGNDLTIGYPLSGRRRWQLDNLAPVETVATGLSVETTTSHELYGLALDEGGKLWATSFCALWGALTDEPADGIQPLSGNPDVWWASQDGAPAYYTALVVPPVITRDYIYLVDAGAWETGGVPQKFGTLRRMDRKTWRVESVADLLVDGWLAAQGDKLIWSCEFGLYRIDLATMSAERLGYAGGPGPLAVDGQAIYAFDYTAGTLHRVTSLRDDVLSTGHGSSWQIQVHQGGVYVAEETTGNVVRVDVASGAKTVLWSDIKGLCGLVITKEGDLLVSGGKQIQRVVLP